MADMEPGSMDLELARVSVGGVKLSNREVLQRDGNKFVVVEHHIDAAGQPIEDRQFDAARMCYALFVSPEYGSESRHRYVVNHHRPVVGKIGRTVGGGYLSVSSAGKVQLGSSSMDFHAEPEILRQRFADLLLPILQSTLNDSNLVLSHGKIYPDDINTYWLRYRQIVEALKAADNVSLSTVEAMIRRFQREERGHQEELLRQAGG